MTEQNNELKQLLEKKEFDVALNYVKEKTPDLDTLFNNNKKPLDYLMNAYYEEHQNDNSLNIKNIIKEFHNNGMSLEENKENPYLYIAVHLNDEEMTDWFLKSNTYNKNERAIALSLSLAEDVSDKIFIKMLKNFPEIGSDEEYKKELLFTMSEYGYKGSENKMFMLMHNSQGINVKNNQEQTIIHTLAMYGSDRILKAALSSHEIDINDLDKNGETPLFKVSRTGENGEKDYISIKNKVKLLVESGVNVLAKNIDKKDAFEVNPDIKDLKRFALSITVSYKEDEKNKLDIKPIRKKMKTM